MNSTFYELLASVAIGGLITGIVVPTLGEWLRGFFNGYHLKKRREKDKQRLVEFIRENSYDDPFGYPTTSFIHEKLFRRRKFGDLYELLMELNREDRISLTIIERGINGSESEHWSYKSAKNRTYFGHNN